MSSEDKRNGTGLSKFILGLAFGAAAGYVIGLLNAERPGSELRKEIAINSKDFFAGLRERIAELKEQASSAIQDFRTAADETVKESALDIEDQVNSLGKKLDDLTRKHINR
jgi:gas vesicle protein